MIARVGNDPCPLRLPNEWLSPCAASTLPSVGLEICASCATRGTCIRTHLFPTPYREAAIRGFGDHPNASITRCIAGAFGSMAARAHMIRLTLTVHLDDERRGPRVHAGGLRFLSLLFMFLEPVSTVVGHRVDHGIGRASRNLPG